MRLGKQETLVKSMEVYQDNIIVVSYVGMQIDKDTYSCECKFICKLVFQDIGRVHISCSICQCGWKFDACNNMYWTKHCTCDGNIEQVYINTTEGALDNSK